MLTITEPNGRLCNQIFRNIAVSMIAQKNNLYVKYSSHSKIKRLGIPLYVGSLKYKHTIELTDDNYLTVFQLPVLQTNLNANQHYFQTFDMSRKIKEYLWNHKDSIIRENPYSNRYNVNNDIFIHVRLTDVQEYNPGINYYLRVIASCQDRNHIYLGTDDPVHIIIQELQLLPNTTLLKTDELQTIQFGSTCKHIILSHGSYSAIIGYLGFFSSVYYPAYQHMWYGDIFSIDGWNKC